MAGHSKWANIKHKKKIKDQQKSKLFTKLANNIKSSLKEKQSSGENNKLKNAINKAVNNNLNKNIINKIISNYDKTEKTELLSFKKNEYILIIESTLDKKNKNISEIKSVLNNNEFKIIDNKSAFNFFEKKCTINIQNYYNEKNITNIHNLKIINFEDNNIHVEYSNIDLIQTQLKNKFIKFNTLNTFYSKKKVNLNINEKDNIKILIKKLNKKDFVINIFSNMII